MELEDLYKRKFSGRDLLAIMDSNDVKIGVGATLMIVEKIDKQISAGNHKQWDFPPNNNN